MTYIQPQVVVIIEYKRGPGVQGRELQLLIEATEDRMLGAPMVSSKIPNSAALPTAASCVNGPSAIPGFRATLIRAIQRTVSRVENEIKLALYPRRKTNLAQTPKEVYNDRVTYGSGGLQSFLTPASQTYPTWTDLDAAQQTQYNNDSTLYTDGTLPWDLLTPTQQRTFSEQVLYVPNKIENEERLDGKGRSYIKFYERMVIKIHKLALEIQDPQGLGIPYLNRTYAPNEYFLYEKEGAVILFPAQAKISATGPNNLIASSGYGLVVPSMPQIVHVDYEYGFKEIPPAMQDAVAMLSAIKAFELLNISYTKGLLNFSVQGFSAAFGKGLYADVMDRYRTEAEWLLKGFQLPLLAAY